MEKKEFPNIKEIPNVEADFKPQGSGFSEKIAGFSNKAFGIIKLILGISLLPFVYSVSAIFLKEFSVTREALQGYFWSGVISFLVIYLIIWEPAIIYTKGHRLLELIFQFFKPMVRVAPYLLPIYTIVLLIIYEILSLTVKSSWLIDYMVFLFGFSIVLHLVFSAKSIRSKKGDFLKANYIFGFSFIYIINMLLLAFCLNLILKEFSFVRFFNGSFQFAKDIFYAVFKQLFL